MYQCSSITKITIKNSTDGDILITSLIKNKNRLHNFINEFYKNRNEKKMNI